MERFCTNCGNPLEEGTLFCPECGQKVEINPVAAAPEAAVAAAAAAPVAEAVPQSSDYLYGMTTPIQDNSSYAYAAPAEPAPAPQAETPASAPADAQDNSLIIAWYAKEGTSA